MHRRVATTLAIALCAVLTACGSSTEGAAPGPNLATVTGGGKSLSFSDDLRRTGYPNPCPLLPSRSAQALVGAPVTASRNSVGCSWTPGVASVPSIMIAFVEIGSDAAERYAQAFPSTPLAGRRIQVGDRARVYGLDENRTTRADVLKGNVFFRVEVRSPLNAAQDVKTARSIANRTAQLVAAQLA